MPFSRTNKQFSAQSDAPQGDVSAPRTYRRKWRWPTRVTGRSRRDRNEMVFEQHNESSSAAAGTVTEHFVSSSQSHLLSSKWSRVPPSSPTEYFAHGEGEARNGRHHRRSPGSGANTKAPRLLPERESDADETPQRDRGMLFSHLLKHNSIRCEGTTRFASSTATSGLPAVARLNTIQVYQAHIVTVWASPGPAFAAGRCNNSVSFGSSAVSRYGRSNTLGIRTSSSCCSHGACFSIVLPGHSD